MWQILTRRRKFTGGLYFGAPGWFPHAIESLPPHEISPAAPELTHSPTLNFPADRAELLAMIERIGLTRTSAVTPGLLDQMRDAGDRRIRALVLNLLPTQPEFALSSALSRGALDDLITGLFTIQRAVGAAKVLVVIDRHEFRVRRLWRRALKGRRGISVSFVKLLNRYPQADPVLLMRSVFAKRVAVGKLPTRANRMIVDPVACWAIARHLASGSAFVERPIQLFSAGDGSGAPRLVMGKIGETIAAFCSRLQIPTEQRQVIVNGMMAGEEVDPAVAKIETSTESISLRPRPAPEVPTPCFSCGWCLDVCPSGLNPVNLLDLAERAQHGIESIAVRAELRSFDARESLHCIGCGLCSYVCPTRLPLTQQAMRLRNWVAAANGGGHA